jgi:uncharacterized protein YjbI with pentapeptide repeats/alpha-tubulin suppressor-like RCC1 family protein
MNILLIDNRVQDYEIIVNAIDPAVAVGIIFDFFVDTYDTVKARISALGFNTSVPGGNSVGLLQHNYNAPIFTMLASAELSPVAQVVTQDPDLTRWTQFRDFILWCKNDLNITYFDMMACALYSNPDWKYVVDALSVQTGVEFRSSTDNTGSAALGGDWFLESHTGVNMKGVYFTDAIDEYRGILFLPANMNVREYSTKGFATGSVIAWGDSNGGGVTPGNVDSNVIAVYATRYAFAALKTNGSVVAWGNSSWGGTDPGITSGVVSISYTSFAFAALKTDGSVVAWGDSSTGGTTPSNVSSNVIEVYSTAYAFAALKNDGSIVSWGLINPAPSSVTAANSGVVKVYSNEYAFAALKTNGSVVAWGHSSYGGSTPASVSSGVVAVCSANAAFAALKSDGSVVAWGDTGGGGIAPAAVSSGVVSIYPTGDAFAALKTDGSVVTWGYLLAATPGTVSSGVVQICSNTNSFAALKADGSVVAWGANSNNVSSNVVAVYSSGGAFAALKTDGSVVGWGSNGGNASSGLVAVYATLDAFAGLKGDGSVVAWGRADSGGTTPAGVSSGVVTIYFGNTTFAALKTTANTFSLSAAYYTDMDRYDILRKKENRRRVDLTTLNNNVYTLSGTRNLQLINLDIPSNKTLRIIMPTYAALPLSRISTATIPSGAGSVIIACDEGEPVIISGTTYVNYGGGVYRIETNNTFTKMTSVTIDTVQYALYGGDGIMSSGIVFLEIILEVSTFSSSTFSVSQTKTIGDAPFAITTRPTSNSNGSITYSSSNTAVATIDASGNFITLVGAGDVSFNATQAATSQYAGATKTSNTLTVLKGTTSLSTFSIANSKTFGAVPFSAISAPTSDSNGAITYSSNDTSVATINASSGLITLVAAGTVTFTASQAETAQYNAPTSVTSNVLTVSKGTPTLVFTTSSISKSLTDANFTVVASSASSGAITYTSSNTAIATVGLTTGIVTLIDTSSVTITAAQADTSQYNAPTNATCTITVGPAANISNTTVTTSLANKNLMGISLVGTVLTNVSLENTNLRNADLSGATITGANFSNTDISGATNLPVFSTTQKLQLMRNANNSAISAIQISTLLSGTEINAATTTPIPDIVGAMFFVKAPMYDVSGVKVVTITATDVSNNASLYIPINSGESVKLNDVLYTLDGNTVLNSTGTEVTFISVLGKPFRLYTGSIVGLNVVNKLNNVKVAGYGLYDILSELFTTKA